MVCIPPAKKAWLRARMAAKMAQLEALETTLLEVSGQTEESYRFDDGEGSQQLKTVDIAKLQKQITILEAQILALNARLAGTGLVNLILRRQRGGQECL